VVEIDDAYAGASDEERRTYFNHLYKDLEAGGYEEFLYFLQNLKLGNWHPRELLRTREAIEQMRMSSDSWSHWAQLCIDADTILAGDKLGLPLPLGTRIPSTELYASYTNYCRQRNMRSMSNIEFGKICASAKMFGARKKCGTKQPPERTHLTVVREDGKDPRPWGYDVPKGEVWQERLDARLGVTGTAAKDESQANPQGGEDTELPGGLPSDATKIAAVLPGS
jgi:hypothetical protein